MSRRDGILARVARMNVRMSNDVYKKMIKKSPLTDSRMSQRAFQEAFHSVNTPDYIRAMLLSSLFKENSNFLPAFKKLSRHASIQKARDMFLVVNEDKGIKSFSLSSWDPSDRKMRAISPSSRMKAEVYAWAPQANKQTLLTRALLSGNAQSQKAAFFFKDVMTAIYAASDMIITNVKLNDPFLLYWDYDPATDKPQKAVSERLGDFVDKQSRFLRDLTHMVGEFDKLFPVLNKMGINTADVEFKMQHLKQNIEQFTATPYNTLREEISAMYRGFESINDLLDSILELAVQVEKLDITDPRIYKLARREVLPTFVDYNLNKLVKHTTAAEDSLMGHIEKLLENFNRDKR